MRRDEREEARREREEKKRRWQSLSLSLPLRLSNRVFFFRFFHAEHALFFFTTTFAEARLGPSEGFLAFSFSLYMFKNLCLAF